MQVLLIMGHPRRDSFCSALAAAYRQRAAEHGIEVRGLVLADLTFDPHVREAAILEQELEPDLVRARELIDWAGHITFIYPIWWGTMPALLKGFLDRILLPGFAFAERGSGNSYEGLLKGKSAQLITTMDTSPWVVKFLLRSPGHRAFSVATLGFCGIAPVRIRMFGPVKHASLAQRLKWTHQVADEADLLKSGRLRGIEATRHRIGIWLKALRLQFYPMTWIAYTAGACWVVPFPALWNEPAYWWGYAVLFFIEAITVFLNEIHDYESDRQNAHHGPFTGGSRVLVDGSLTSKQLRSGINIAGVLGFISLALLQFHSPATSGANFGLVSIALLLGIAYTVPPAKLCHRGAGEATVAFTHSLMVVQCGILFLGGAILPPPVWIIGLPLFFAVFPSITLSGIPDRVADMAAGKRTLAVRFGIQFAHLIAILATTLAVLLVLALQLSPLPGRWPAIAVTGMLAHGAILTLWLTRSLKLDRSPRIDGLMALALSFILWFAISPLFASQQAPGKMVTREESARPRIDGDLIAVNQIGETVRLSDLHGKVWAVTGFFAACPLCARASSTDLKSLAKTFAKSPDFHLVCISIDPERDDVKKLAAYAQALGADARNWWFLTGDHSSIHHYLEKHLKFPPAIERTDVDEIASMGRFQHDLGITVIDRDMRIVGKRNLSWAADQSPQLHDQWEEHLHGIIRNELAKAPHAP